MIVKNSTYLTPIICCLALSTIALSGCRTAKFERPSLGKLAFWKKDNGTLASRVPPPPARHFDPAPIDGRQIANNVNETETINLNGQRFADSIAQTTDSAPIRQPYSTGMGSETKPTGSSTKPMGSSTKPMGSGTKPMAQMASNTLSNAQQDFNSAMQNTMDSVESAKSKANKWKDDFQFPNLQKPSMTVPSSTNQSLAAIGKKPVYDAEGKLVSSVNEATNSFHNKIAEANNAFRAKASDTLDSANQFVANTANNVSTGFTAPTEFKAPNQFSGEFSPPQSTFSAPKEFVNNVTSTVQNLDSAKAAELEKVQAQVAQAKLQIEQLKQQVALAKQNQTPATPAGNSMMPNLTMPKLTMPAPTTSSVSPPGNTQFTPQQLAQLQQMISQQQMPQPSAQEESAQQRLRAQPQNQALTQPVQPPQRVAQLQTPRFGNSNYTPSPALDFDGNTPANVLRSGQTAMPQTQQTTTKPSLPEQTLPSYPSTPHGGYQGSFGKNFAPTGVSSPDSNALKPQPASSVGFQTPDSSTIHKAATPLVTPNSSSSASRIKSHISEIDIPADILRGSGSYAPGSVHGVSR